MFFRKLKTTKMKDTSNKILKARLLLKVTRQKEASKGLSSIAKNENHLQFMIGKVNLNYSKK